MKIALLIPNLAGGGAERMMARLATRFADLGHTTDLVLLNRQRNHYASEVSSRVRVVDLGVGRWRLANGVWAFRRYLRSQRPDCVLSALPTANTVAAWAGRLTEHPPRLVISERNTSSSALGGLTPRRRSLPVALRGFLIRSSYRFADGIVAISDGVAERLKTVPGVDVEKMHLIHNPAWSPEIEKRAAEPVSHAWLQVSGPPTLLSVGRLEAQKDFATLIEAFALLDPRLQARLIILGEGSQRAVLEALVRRLDLQDRVSMPGFVENPFSFMSRASMFVMSSLHEGFGNVLVEAMACGTPVVATDCPSGPADILDGGRYGRLVPVGDAAALAAAMEATLAKPISPSVLKQRAMHFSLEKAADAYLAVIGVSAKIPVPA